MASEQEELENTAEAEIAQERREAAKKSAAEGTGEVAAGAAELGAARTLDALVEEPEE